MRAKPRPEPIIPDHEVLRKIGGGSYGEVWLARGVTGAMRAVKVVSRADFEDERGFEREFEGILKYEPMSRDHPGLVNILHVGRGGAEGDAFYYYVMELGEDVRSGREINPVEYEPRNLRTDMLKSKGTPLDPNFVIDVGIRLSDALQHLHERGLAHRDIKPSNIIFVDGKAKLADIGLVATRGQRTFVGTEGFVPPEGPGSAQADVYGLGKVLYEMGSGKDRLQFPELPDELPDETDRKRWLALNQVICDICEPRVTKRRIKTAGDLAISLRRLQRGKRVRHRRQGAMFALLPALALIVLAGWLLRDRIPWQKFQAWIGQEDPVEKPIAPPAKIEYGFVKVISEPSGAEVYDAQGNFIDITPSSSIKVEANKPFEFTIKMEGYRTESKRGTVKPDESEIVDHTLAIYDPPVIGQPWVDNFGISYQPVDNYHISSGFVRFHQWQRYLKETNKSSPVEVIDHSESGIKRRIVLASAEQAKSFSQWHSTKALNGGYLNDEQEILPRVETSFKSPHMSDEAREGNLRPFRCIVRNIPFAFLAVHTVPEGADVLINGEYKEVTPLSPERVKPGKTEVSISMEGYRRVTRMIDLKDGAREKLTINLQRDNSVVFGEKWTDSLGMKFVPVTDDLLVSIWETRVKDFAAYTKATGKPMPKSPGFRQGPNHPVLHISRDMAQAFCKWLTTHEQKLERISSDVEYRLLTDWEWSLIAGLRDNPGDKPSLRELRKVELFPWGTVWPPEDMPKKVGNFADETAAKASSMRRSQTLANYDDGFEKTSPVGSFMPNPLGIYDLAGNAHEWVSDDYNGKGKYGVLRGGGWNSYTKKHLYVTHRNTVRASKTSNLYGFRIALVRKIKKLTSDFEENTP